MLVKGATGVRLHDNHSDIWLLSHTSSFLLETGEFSVRWWFPGSVCSPFFWSQPSLTAEHLTGANYSKELWPWTNVIWLSQVHQFFFWNSPLITPVQLDPSGGVVGINCLFVCWQVPIRLSQLWRYSRHSRLPHRRATIWTPMSSVLKKADKLNLSLSLPRNKSHSQHLKSLC